MAWSRFAVAVTVLVLAVTTASCVGERPPSIQALGSDPMASYEADHAALVDRSVSTGGEFMGKPVRGSIVQRYEIAADADPGEVKAAAVAAAEQHGWTFFARGEVASAFKTIEGFPATLGAHLAEEDGRHYLNVTLLTEHGRS